MTHEPVNLFGRSTSWIVTRPVWSWMLIVVISAVAVCGYCWPGAAKDWLERQFGTPPVSRLDEARLEDPESVLVDDGPSFDRSQLDRSRNESRSLAAGGDLVLVCESDQFFTQAGTAAMREVVQALEADERVESVMWMDRAPPLNLFGLPEPLLPRGRASERKFERAREQAMLHPFVGGQLISEDGRVMPLFVNVRRHLITSDEQIVSGFREIAEEVVSRHPGFSVQISTTGTLPMVTTALASHDANQIRFQTIAYSLILVMSIVLFRGIIATLVLALAPAMGVFWTLGFVKLFLNFENNPFVDVVLPILVALVGFTDGVHLMVQVRRNRAGGMAGADAAIAGLRQVGLACALTSLTTAIGFGSLHLAEHDYVRQFGHGSVLGVVLSFVAVITVIPLACRSPLGERIHVGHQRGIIDRNLMRIGGVVAFVLRRPWSFSCLGIGLTLFLAACTLMLRPDDRRMNTLPDNSEAALALKKLDESLGGLEEVRVELRSQSDQDRESQILDLLDVTDQVHSLVEAEPLFSRPMSITSLLAGLPGSGDSRSRASMTSLLPPPMMEMFLRPDNLSSIVRFRVRDLGIAAYGPPFEHLQEEFKKIQELHPGIRIDLKGDAIWRWHNLYQIVMDLASSLGLASLIIFGVLAVAYRSLRLGLISVVPNIFPLTVAGAYLYFTGQSLEIVSVCAFTCCLGIAVDDTIHFLTRYVEEQRQGGDRREAIRRAFVNVGTALVMTTIVLVIGLLSVLLSDSREHRTFAILGAITLTSALFADLVFLPAMIAVFDRRKK